MKNHFLDIVNEQVDLIVKSGLYNNIESIHIGCLGDEEDLQKIRDIILPFSKFIISYYSSDILEYEFPTLNILKETCDNSNEPFSLFYIHTKGASFGIDHQKGFIGGNYWRGYMNYYNISNWQTAVSYIENGYDIVGTKIRGEWTEKQSPNWKQFYQNSLDRGEWRFKNPLHYSGNFFWCSSEYVKRLQSINSLDKTNRFNAEFWICSASPRCESMCQDWVDYNSKGIWQDPQQIMKRNIVHTLCWNVFSEVEKAVDDLYTMNDSKDFIHVLVDLGFPIEEGDIIPDDIERAKINNSNKLVELAKKYGSVYFKTDNIGVSQNWTAVSKFMNVTEFDVLICCDPDERVKTNGWVRAVCDVMRSDERYGWISLTMPEHFPILDRKGITEFTNTGYRVWEINGLVNWAQGALSGRLIVKMGGEIPFMQTHSVYGHLEAAVMRKIQDFNYKWAMLPDYIVQHTDDVPLLRAWKDQIIHKIAEYGQLSFEKWLSMKKQNLL